jgi:SHAQKYF class myb-like DNA-binding protein
VNGRKKRTVWTLMEHLNFLKAFRAFGRDWLAIARYVETKDEDQIRSHGQVFINKVRANGKKLKEVLDSFDLSTINYIITKFSRG